MLRMLDRLVSSHPGPICLFLEEVVVWADHKVLVEVDNNRGLIVEIFSVSFVILFYFWDLSLPFDSVSSTK